MPHSSSSIKPLFLMCGSLLASFLLRASLTTTVAMLNIVAHVPVLATATTDGPQLRLSVRSEALQRVPSCQHTFSQLELVNEHATESVIIHSIQTSPEETVLMRYDPHRPDQFAEIPNAASSHRWHQSSIPQQVYLASKFRLESDRVRLEPGQMAVVPLTFLPRYPCTFGHNLDSHALEEYYEQQQYQQYAFSSTWKGGDNTTADLFSGTARSDWAELAKELPPQRRSNWQQQQQQQQQPSGTLHPTYSPSEHNDQQRPSQPIATVTEDGRDQQQPQTKYDDQQQQQQPPPPPTPQEEWVFDVRTKITVETSRGNVVLPVHASSVRRNSYGLPDVIYFDQDAEDGNSNNNNNHKDDNSHTDTLTQPENINNAPITPSPSSSPYPAAVMQPVAEQPPTLIRDLAGAPAATKPSGVLWLETDRAKRGSDDSDEDDEDREGLTDEDEISHQTFRDCYNLILTNPDTSEDMYVEEVSVTHPDRMNLQVLGQLRAPSAAIQQWWNSNLEKGPLILKPGEQSYVVTVCTSRGSGGADVSSDTVRTPDDDWEDDMMMMDAFLQEDALSVVQARAARAAARAARAAAQESYSLGFLQIRTRAGQNFYIALERERKLCRSNGNTTDMSGVDSPQAAPSRLHPPHAYPPSYHRNVYQQAIREMTVPTAQTVPVAPTTPILESALKAVPPRLDFSLLTGSSPKIVAYLGITNPKDYPVKIMRAGVAVELEDDVDPDQPNPQELGLHMTVKILESMLEPDSTTQHSLMVTCSISWENFQAHELESLHYHGTVIFRATANVELNYNQWIRHLFSVDSNTEKRSEKDDKVIEFVVEVPLSVSIVQGKIGIMIHHTSHPFPHLWAVKSWKEGLGSISSIFYPKRPFEIRAEIDVEGDPRTEPVFGYEGIRHELRVFTNIHFNTTAMGREPQDQQSLQLASAEIVGDTDHGNVEAICRRFDIVVGPPPKGHFPFAGFIDVGVVHITYNFPRDEEENAVDHIVFNSTPGFPTHCRLAISTDPPTEVHAIPLVVYPGQMEVTGTPAPMLPNVTASDGQNSAGSQSTSMETDWEDSTNEESHAVVGYEGLLNWFRASPAGKALRRVLEAADFEKREHLWSRRGPNSNDDNKLLGNYVANICRKSLLIKNVHLRPVLLKVGAVRHGSTETSSFYFTNHNPIPLLVSIDVAEVQGMSISLARVPTRGQGDGNNILDHFPKERNMSMPTMPGHSHHEGVLVPDGELEGHPLAGLRKFLQSDEIAQQFMRIFRFRDSISLSPSAVQRQPLLNNLYKKYAFGEFHRDPLPFRISQDGWSHCRRRRGGNSTTTTIVESTPPDSDDEGMDDDVDSLEGDSSDDEGVLLGPMMVSDDAKATRRLKVCWDKESESAESPSDGTYIIIPPAAVARFELKLYAPPRSMLHEDVTRFLSSGLVLSTDHGEVMPIFVSYETLLGDLQIGTNTTTSFSSDGLETTYNGGKYAAKRDKRLARQSAADNVTIIRVPAGLFNDHACHGKQLRSACATGQIDEAKAKTRTKGVALFANSTFTRDVRILKMSSCSPWFNVDLQLEDGLSPVLHKVPGGTSDLGVHIGFVRSQINCHSDTSSISPVEYPSFYLCAVNWLTKRAALQPRGCGVPPTFQKRRPGDDDKSSEHGSVERAIQAMRTAILVSKYSFGSSADNGPASKKSAGGGVVPSVTMDVFAESWDAWRVVSEFGLHVLSATLKATIEYDSIEGLAKKRSSKRSRAQNLSVSMRDFAIETVLAVPKLFDEDRAKNDYNLPHAVTGEGGSPSVVEFPPALVANVVSITLPLRNPTSVPVRVRLAAAPRGYPKTVSEKGPLAAESNVDDEVLETFMEIKSSPYVQNGWVTTATNYQGGVPSEQSWWDGGGGYFLSDEYGDIMRSHHSIRIKAAAGAEVSLVNPSLQTNIAHLAGCGVRCGLRDEVLLTKKHDSQRPNAKFVSPIGAAAALGVTLAGRKRSALPQINLMSTDEPFVSAGAASPGIDDGPAAFAIPYSSLVEMVIPPYGEIDVGPILFRPPGRYSIHGCQALLDNSVHATPGVGDKAKMCSSNIYQSMLYLENSLTGLERIILRGKALWERVVFLDPPPTDSTADAFGDIENINGLPTLLFSGSRADNGRSSSDPRFPESTIPGSVIKKILVHNEGDVPSQFASVYLSDTSRLYRKQSGAVSDGCSLGQFRVLNCWNDANSHLNVQGHREGPPEGANVRFGFSLQPGESFPIFIEHFPDCTRRNEFIALNLEHRRRKHRRDSLHADDLLSLSGDPRSPRASEWNSFFRHRKVELMIGYDMSEIEFKSCLPVTRWGSAIQNKFGARFVNATSESFPSEGSNQWWNYYVFLGREILTLAFDDAIVLASALLILRGYYVRRRSAGLFASALSSRRKAYSDVSNGKAANAGPQLAPSRGNWSATFRCLARADPSSTDLQTLGREQIRHVVLGRFKTMGILPPQCFNSNGVFNRERVGVVSSGSPSRQLTGKEGNVAASERVRTFSDTVFRTFSVPRDKYMQNALPCGLDWRPAYARGVFKPASLEPYCVRTSELLRQRADTSEDGEYSSDDDDTEDSARESEASLEEGSDRADDESIPAEHESTQFTEEDESQMQPSVHSEISEMRMLDSSENHSEDLCLRAVDKKTANLSVENVVPSSTLIEVKVPNGTEVNSTLESFPAKVGDLAEMGIASCTTTGGEAALAHSIESNIPGPSTVRVESRDSQERSASEVTTNTTERISQPHEKKSWHSRDDLESKIDTRDKNTANRGSLADDEISQTILAQEQEISENNDSRSKKSAARTGSRGKAAAEKEKESALKTPTPREKKGSGASVDSRSAKAPENDEAKVQRRKGQKGDNAGKRLAKDGASGKKDAPTDGKHKATPTKKGKKGRSGGSSNQTPKVAKTIETEVAVTTPKPPFVLRPPPGLPPPPGFGQSNTIGQSLNDLPSSSFDSALLSPSTFLGDQPFLGNPQTLSSTSALGLSPSLLSGDPVPLSTVPGLGSPLHGTATLRSSSIGVSAEELLAGVTSTPMMRNVSSAIEGFDVMDFLDSILNDTSSSSAANTSHRTKHQASEFLTATAVTPLQTLPSNPWAMEQSSRASAYGIAITDATTGRMVGGSPSLERSVEPVISLPLLSTAQVLSMGDVSVSEDDEDDGDSFYAGLLGGLSAPDDEEDLLAE